MRSLFSSVLAAGLLAACSPPDPGVLDKFEILERQDWWDNRDFDWYAANVPFFESPDSVVDRTYWYRWEVVTKHLTYGSPKTGYTFTEFIDRPHWSGTYGGISCPLGHQHYEVRWLKDRRIVENFARYWHETPGAEPRSYSNWYGDAMWATYLVTGDRDFLRGVLPLMERQYAGWIAERWDEQHRMFRWDGMHDGMETNINSRLTENTFSGAEGYRPTLNSYLYADARAIGHTARLLGDVNKAAAWADRAEELKKRVQDELWDPERTFFHHQYAEDEKDGIRAKSLTYETGPLAGSPYGRELIGYVPWQFNLPDPGYEEAWRFLMDSTRFATPFGPPTVEVNDPQFLVSPRCCEWSGNQWPYATTQTLAAMANLLNDYEQTWVDREDYAELFRTYARLHQKDGRPYVAEAADPYTGSWDGHDSYYHSEHYFHSAFVDLLITGLVGLRPQEDDVIVVNPLIPDEWDWFALDDVAFRGRSLSILWDRDGSRYGRGAGLSIMLDGEMVANRADRGRLEVAFEPSSQEPAERSINIAVNNDGMHFPFASASFSEPLTPPFWAQDGHKWYHESPPNYWSARGSASGTDWYRVDFGVERPVERVALYFMDNREDLVPPRSFEVEIMRDGEWQRAEGVRRPAGPEGRKANHIALGRVTTSAIRVVFEHAEGAATGLTEFEVWAPDVPGAWADPAEPPANLATNASATASYTFEGDRVQELNDGRFGISRYSRNRWTAYGSQSPEDWVGLTFAEPSSVSSLELYFYGDGGGVKAPESYRVEYASPRGWQPVTGDRRNPQSPLASAANTVQFDPVTTRSVRVVFSHALPAFTGLTELRAFERLPGDEP